MSSGKAAGSSLANVERAEEEKIPQDPCSDGEGEGGERTAREKLKKTSIAGLSQFSAVKPDEEADDQVPNESAVSDNLESLPDAQAETGLRGRPSKKRSYEDLQTEDPGAGVENGGPPLPKKGLHKRMRSREVSGADGIQGGVDKLEDIASPVQEESDAEAHKSPGGPGVLVSAPAEEEETTVAAAEADIVQDTPQEAAESAPPVAAAAEDHKHTVSDRIIATSTPHEAPSNPQVPSSSGFANISSASPFSNLKSPKSPVQGSESGPSPAKTTSASAFASSGLSAFASSEKSPFDRLGSTAKSGGGFGGGATAISRLGSAASSGGFGGPSPFASKPASGFGSGGGFGSASSFGGGGFGAAKPFGSGTTTSSFAGSSSVAGTFGKPKPFAATTEADEDGSENGDDDEEQGEDDDERDPRFKEQESEYTYRRVLDPAPDLKLIYDQSKPVKKMKRQSSAVEPSCTTSKRSGRNAAWACLKSTFATKTRPWAASPRAERMRRNKKKRTTTTSRLEVARRSPPSNERLDSSCAPTAFTVSSSTRPSSRT
jgi:hypothetical protein